MLRTNQAWNQGILWCQDVCSGFLKASRLRPCSRSYITCSCVASQLRRQSLHMDIKAYGGCPTPHQALQVDARQRTIMNRLDAHRANVINYYPIPMAEGLLQETCRVEGEPERMSTLIPSDYSSISTLSQLHENAVRTECKLRRTSCLKALQTVRSLSIQHAQVTRTQLRQPHGRHTTTCSQLLLDQYHQRIANTHW
jgi:hypothetical protein